MKRRIKGLAVCLAALLIVSCGQPAKGEEGGSSAVLPVSVSASYESVTPQVPEMNEAIPKWIRQFCEDVAVNFGEYGMGCTLLPPEMDESGWISFQVVTYGRDLPPPEPLPEGAVYSIGYTDPDSVVEQRLITFYNREGDERNFRVSLDMRGERERDYKLWAAMMMALDDSLDYPHALGLAQHFYEGWPEEEPERYLDVGPYRMVGEHEPWLEEKEIGSIEFFYLPFMWDGAREAELYHPMQPQWVEDYRQPGTGGVLCSLEGVVTEMRKVEGTISHETWLTVEMDDGNRYELWYTFRYNPMVFNTGERYFFEGICYEGAVYIERAVSCPQA